MYSLDVEDDLQFYQSKHQKLKKYAYVIIRTFHSKKEKKTAI